MSAHQRHLVRVAAFGLSLASVAVFWVTLTVAGGMPVDARAFYELDLGNLYVDDEYAYLWSPAFAHLTAPFRALPFDAFVALVRLLEGAALVAMAPLGAWLFVWLTPVAAEINAGNINLLLIGCVVLSLRWPAAWLLPLITKPTMGIGLLWYVARGEWRNLAIAVGVTGAICVASFALAPQLWFEWVAFLRASVSDVPGWPFPVPVWPRLPIAAVLVVVGARTDRPWLLGLAAIIAMPRLYFLSIAMFVGLLPLLRRRGERTAIRG